jgi:hypothetical protein
MTLLSCDIDLEHRFWHLHAKLYENETRCSSKRSMHVEIARSKVSHDVDKKFFFVSHRAINLNGLNNIIHSIKRLAK